MPKNVGNLSGRNDIFRTTKTGQMFSIPQATESKVSWAHGHGDAPPDVMHLILFCYFIISQTSSSLKQWEKKIAVCANWKTDTHACLHHHMQQVSRCCCELGNMAQPMNDAIRSHLLDDCFHMCSPFCLPAAAITTVRNTSNSSLFFSTISASLSLVPSIFPLSFLFLPSKMTKSLPSQFSFPLAALSEVMLLSLLPWSHKRNRTKMSFVHT